MSETKPPPSTGCFGCLKMRFPILQKKRGKVLLIALLCTPLLGLLGLLALRNRHDAAGYDAADGAGSEGLIRADIAFYGQSEPVYPSRESIPPLPPPPSPGLGLNPSSAVQCSGGVYMWQF